MVLSFGSHRKYGPVGAAPFPGQGAERHLRAGGKQNARIPGRVRVREVRKQCRTPKENDKKTIKPTETQGPCPGKVSVSAPLLQAPIFMSMLPDGPASKGAARDDAMRQPQLHTNKRHEVIATKASPSPTSVHDVPYVKPALSQVQC